MKAIPYEERIRLGCLVPEAGQFEIMRQIPDFCAPEVCREFGIPKEKRDVIRAAVFNVEHGTRIREILSFLRECPELRDADILFGNELDDGTERSGNIDASREIAKALGFEYAYGLEFIELVNPNDLKGYEGNTLFSRWPIVHAESFYPPEGYNWYFDEQKRIGGRVAVFAELDVAGQHVGAVSVHFENRTTPGARALQMEAILRRADELFPGLPVLIGGDFNPNAFDYSPEAAFRAYEQQQEDGVIVDPAPFEPLFDIAENAGYDYRSLNGKHLPTRRRPTGDDVLNLHLDWIFGKNVTAAGHGMVSTLLKDCDWAAADSPLRSTDLIELSDHNAVWTDVRIG